jgi:hypothetical protein
MSKDAPIPDTNSFPRAAILDAWSESEWNNGIHIDQLPELTTLAVRTRNTVYEITILNGHTGDVLVCGGDYFPERTPVRLEGSSFGGSILKRLFICPGLRMEIVPEPVEMVSRVVHNPMTGRNEVLLGHKAVITSPVQFVEIVL